jgi:hypothetical protein
MELNFRWDVCGQGEIQERAMADNAGSSFLGVILGGIVVVLVIIGIFVYSGGMRGGDTVRVELPKPTIAK